MATGDGYSHRLESGIPLIRRNSWGAVGVVATDGRTRGDSGSVQRIGRRRRREEVEGRSSSSRTIRAAQTNGAPTAKRTEPKGRAKGVNRCQ